jgi:hypothetical protein
LQSAAFTLGGFSYAPSGQIWTNSALPGDACSPTPTGRIQFELKPGQGLEPGAWNLTGGILIAEYTDIVSDGTLPATPSPQLGRVNSLSFYDPSNLPFSTFQDRNFTPVRILDNSAPVPEPGTMAMMGIGLVLGARRWRRGRG